MSFDDERFVVTLISPASLNRAILLFQAGLLSDAHVDSTRFKRSSALSYLTEKHTTSNDRGVIMSIAAVEAHNVNTQVG